MRAPACGLFAELVLRAALADSTSAHCCAADADGGAGIISQQSSARCAPRRRGRAPASPIDALRLTRPTRPRALSRPTFPRPEPAGRQLFATPPDAARAA